jgi:uncharacterized protein (DUF2237 family)
LLELVLFREDRFRLVDGKEIVDLSGRRPGVEFSGLDTIDDRLHLCAVRRRERMKCGITRIGLGRLGL